jgi:DNA-binding SARP family transcriptional activator
MPWLLYWMGAAHSLRNMSEGRAYFEKAFAQFRQQLDYTGALLAWCAIVEFLMYSSPGSAVIEAWIVRLETMLSERPNCATGDLEARVAAVIASTSLYFLPNHPLVQKWLDRAQAIADSDADIRQRRTINFHRAYFYMTHAEWGKAWERIQAFRRADSRSDADPLFPLLLLLLEADYGWILASPDACLPATSKGLALSAETGIHVVDKRLLGAGVCAQLLKNDLPAAETFLKQMAVNIEHTPPFDESYYNHLAALVALISGDPARARPHAERALIIGRQSGIPFTLILSYLAMAHVCSTSGEQQEAEQYLVQASRLSSEVNCGLTEFPVLLMTAQLAFDRNDHDKGLVALRQAMALGRQRSIVNTHLWLPSQMTELCVKALQAGIETEYVHMLVQKRQLIPPAPPLMVKDWPWEIRVFTLSQFAVRKHGMPLEFSRKVQRRPLELLKGIVAFGGRDIPEGDLMDALWPDSEGDAAHQALATTLFRLRKLLGDEAVMVSGGRLSLSRRVCWVDAWAFEYLIDRAGAAGMAGDSRESSQLYEQALSLYQGVFLPADDTMPWAQQFRERLHLLFIRGMIALGRLWEESQEFEKTVDLFQRAVMIDPEADTFYPILITALSRLGRKAEATAMYRHYRATVFSGGERAAPQEEVEKIERVLRLR